MGLIENQFSIIYCPQRKGVLLILPCIQILFQPHDSEAFALQNIPSALLSVTALSEIISKCHILSPVQECCDHLYSPHYMHALKQTIRPLQCHSFIHACGNSSLPDVLWSFICLSVPNLSALSAKLSGRAQYWSREEVAALQHPHPLLLWESPAVSLSQGNLPLCW